MANDWLSSQSRTLEDLFFAKEDRILAEKLAQMKKMQETKQALAEVSGIHNEQVLQRLVELDIHPEIMAALAVVPLVEIAWADGSIDDKEREAVLAAVERAGVKKGKIEYDLIQRWLTEKPKAQLLDAWTHYIQGLCEKLESSQKESLQRELLGTTRSIAEASGGVLGMRKISKSEAELLQKLEAAFQ